MKIVFMGTPDFAIPSLRILVENGYDVVGVVTAPDKPTGRGQKVSMTPIKKFALEQGLHVLQPPKLKAPEFHEELQSLNPDLFIVVAFRMLPEVVWSMPAMGTFNLHASLLPDYRGAAPINWAIINGEKQTGATTFFIEKEIDTGNLLLQTKLDIPLKWNAGDLHDALMDKGAQLVLDTVKLIESGEAQPTPQDHTQYKHSAPKIFKEDCKIDWNQPVEQVYNFIRGMSPYPTAWTILNGLILKIYTAKPVETDEPAAPGKVMQVGKELWISAQNGWLSIEMLQLQGKRRMEIGDFLNGYKEELAHVE